MKIEGKVTEKFCCNLAWWPCGRCGRLGCSFDSIGQIGRMKKRISGLRGRPSINRPTKPHIGARGGWGAKGENIRGEKIGLI